MVKTKYAVIGMEYWKQNLDKLKVKNVEYETLPQPTNTWVRIYEYTFPQKPVKLFLNPNNKIEVHLNGLIVGYIPDDDLASVRDIILNKSIKYMYLQIKGGNCFIISPNGDIDKDSDRHSGTLYIGYSD